MHHYVFDFFLAFHFKAPFLSSPPKRLLRVARHGMQETLGSHGGVPFVAVVSRFVFLQNAGAANPPNLAYRP
jgi:hypothetical protein